jgi:hypothetical protein
LDIVAKALEKLIGYLGRPAFVPGPVVVVLRVTWAGVSSVIAMSGIAALLSMREFWIRIPFWPDPAPLVLCAAPLFRGELVIGCGTVHPVVFRAPTGPMTGPPCRYEILAAGAGAEELPGPVEAASRPQVEIKAEGAEGPR